MRLDICREEAILLAGHILLPTLPPSLFSFFFLLCPFNVHFFRLFGVVV